MMIREVDQLAVDAFLAPNAMALEFDINTIAPKKID